MEKKTKFYSVIYILHKIVKFSVGTVWEIRLL